MQIAFHLRFSCVSAAFQLRFSSLEEEGGLYFSFLVPKYPCSSKSNFWSNFFFCVSAVFQLRFSWQKWGAHPLVDNMTPRPTATATGCPPHRNKTPHPYCVQTFPQQPTSTSSLKKSTYNPGIGSDSVNEILLCVKWGRWVVLLTK